MRSAIARRLLAAAVVAASAGCALLAGIHDPIVVDEDGASDGSNDVAVETGDSGTVYYDMTDKNRWAIFDTSLLNGSPLEFIGGAYVAPKVYFVPSSNLVVQFDTSSQQFTSPSSWTFFDTLTLPGVGDASVPVSGFQGAATDGQYVFFAPNPVNQSACPALRFDTKQSLTSQSAWNTFDIQALDGGPCACASAVFDGKYVTFMPAPAATSIATRFDTGGSFTGVIHWSTFDTSTLLDGGGKIFSVGGGVSDGQHVYDSPLWTHKGHRIDPSAFSSPAGWETIDVATTLGLADASSFGFIGAAYVAGFVYYVPHGNPSLVARYDKGQAFGAASAWSTFDTTTLDPNAVGFYGAVYDGRFLYFLPQCSGGAPGSCGKFPEILVRYDTQSSFTAPSSWSTFDIRSVFSKLYGFHGAVFDGKYIYFIPGSGSVGLVARFEAKDPPSMPTGYSGSFF